MKNIYNTYKKSGVNMASADKLVDYISKISRKTYKKNTEKKSFKNIGSFGSIFDLSKLKMKNPIIVASTDGVGTKIEIANMFNKYNTIGIDLVAMCVNDLIVQGAKPIFFLDYVAVNKINLPKLKSVLRNPITKFIFLKLPKNLRLKLTGQLRKKSVDAQSYKTEELMDVNQASTDLLMSHYPGFDLIHGHTHRQKTHNEEKYTRHVLGDWSSTKGNAIKITDKLEWLEIN